MKGTPPQASFDPQPVEIHFACPNCGYDLFGLKGNLAIICPECGTRCPIELAYQKRGGRRVARLVWILGSCLAGFLLLSTAYGVMMMLFETSRHPAEAGSSRFLAFCRTEALRILVMGCGILAGVGGLTWAGIVLGRRMDQAARQRRRRRRSA